MEIYLQNKWHQNVNVNLNKIEYIINESYENIFNLQIKKDKDMEVI